MPDRGTKFIFKLKSPQKIFSLLEEIENLGPIVDSTWTDDRIRIIFTFRTNSRSGPISKFAKSKRKTREFGAMFFLRGEIDRDIWMSFSVRKEDQFTVQSLTQIFEISTSVDVDPYSLHDNEFRWKLAIPPYCFAIKAINSLRPLFCEMVNVQGQVFARIFGDLAGDIEPLRLVTEDPTKLGSNAFRTVLENWSPPIDPSPTVG